jgi:hypothetical protein
VDDVSVFRLDPVAAAWLAGTYGRRTPQRALLKALALSAEANLERHVDPNAGDDQVPPPMRDLLSDAEVSAIVASVSAAYPDVALPSEPGPAQRRAIDEVIGQRPQGS